MRGAIDTEAVKAARPIEHVVGGYGIELRASGRTLVGRCPFHRDGGRPNLTVYPHTASWYCFRCGVGGDAIGFVRRIEGVGFLEAVDRLGGDPSTQARHPIKCTHRAPAPPEPRPLGPQSPEEAACLAAAVEFYRNALHSEPGALGYATERGVSRETLDRLRIGYCSGGGLLGYLGWLGLPLEAAVGAGLLVHRRGRLVERMAGRVVAPEMRGGSPVWLVGRAWPPDDGRVKYLGLPGTKPLLGWEGARGSPEVYVTEGVFDWLALVEWGLPAVAIVGTHAGRDGREALARFDRAYLALDGDAAGREAAAGLAGELGERAAILRLPGAKDVAELALRPNGRAALLRAARIAEGGGRTDPRGGGAAGRCGGDHTGNAGGSRGTRDGYGPRSTGAPTG